MKNGPLSRVLIFTLAAVFLVAGFTKVWYPDDFMRVLRFLAPRFAAPIWVALSATIGISLYEILLAVWLLTRARQGGALIAAVVTLFVFLGILFVLWRSPNPPGCACLGPIHVVQAHTDAFVGMFRNLALIWIALWLLFQVGGDRREHPTPRVSPSAGFSIIEMLVTIVVLAILLALTLPSLANARRLAKNNGRVRTVQQLGIALSTYGSDYREVFPFFGVEGDPYGPITIRGFVVNGPFFQMQRWHWASVIVPDYYPERSSIEAAGRAAYMQSVLGYPDWIVASDYQLSSTVFAQPPFWREDDSGGNAWFQFPYFARTRHSDMQFPSLKGLLVPDIAGPGGHPDWWRPGTPPPVAFGDGSARAVPLADFDDARAVARPFGTGDSVILSTRDGLAGRDF